MNSEVCYLEGNACFAEGKFDEAILMYSKGLDMLSSQSPLDLKIKLLLNKSISLIKIRSYEDAIKDCSQVIHLDNENVKAWFRRAMAFEYLGDFRKSLYDIEYLLNSHKLPKSLEKPCFDMRSRLNNLQQREEFLFAEEGEHKELINKNQCLRLNFAQDLPHEVHLIKQSSNSWQDICLPVRLCITNEFGLWNRSYMKCGLCMSSNDCTHVPSVKVSKVLLCGGKEYMNKILCDVDTSTPSMISKTGKADFKINICVNEQFNAHDCIVFMILFELSSPLPHFCGTTNDFSAVNVIPLISMPLCIKNKEMPHTAALFEYWRAFGGSVHSQCVRKVDVMPPSIDNTANSSVFVLESPGFLGIAGKIWDSTFVILSYLVSNFQSKKENSLLYGKVLLELGSGTGVCGIALQQFHPKCVIITDLPDVVPLINENIALNMHISGCDSSTLIGASLPWGDAIPPLFTGSTGSTPLQVSSAAVQVIIGSDIVYEPDFYAPLVHTIRSVLKGDGLDVSGSKEERSRVMIMAHRHRHPEDYKFFQLAADAQLVIEEIEYSYNNESSVCTDVKLLRITCK